MGAIYNKASAIIVAAGKGSRMNSKINKQYLMLDGKPVLAYSIEAFEKAGCISEIIVVINKNDNGFFVDSVLKPYGFKKITAIVEGGEDRQASVFNGLCHVSPGSEIVAVHDGARPFVTADIIQRSVDAALIDGAACVGVPVKDTIKKVDEELNVEHTPDRSMLWTIQTPQTFRRNILVDAHEKAVLDGSGGTDHSVLAERLGYKVRMVMGGYTNIKINTAEDLVFAEAILKKSFHSRD